MKAIKMLGLAALTALLAMAFVGASSAMAERTALCSADATECEAVTHVHETSVGKAKLLASIGTTECNVLFLGDVKLTGSPLVIEGNFTYTNCELLGGSCTATEENGPSEIKVLKEGHEKSKVTGEGLVHLVCGSSINCSYNGTGLIGTGKGPLLSTQTNGEVTISGQVTTKEAGGFLCPKEAKLDITTTPLEATYINGGLHYCVEYNEKPTHGFYTDVGCGTLGSPFGRNYRYMLVVGPAGLTVGTTVCVALGPTPHIGLYSNATCTNDVADNSLWEKGIIKTVQ